MHESISMVLDRSRKYLVYLLIAFLVLLFIDGFLRMLSGNQIARRRAYWAMRVEQEIPVGSTWDEIVIWAQDNSVLVEDTLGSVMSGVLEIMPDPGLEFPCSEWRIMLTIRMSPDARSTAQAVTTEGKCL